MKTINYEDELENVGKDFVEFMKTYVPDSGPFEIKGEIFDTEEKIRAEWDRLHKPGVRFDGLQFPETYEEFREMMLNEYVR